MAFDPASEFAVRQAVHIHKAGEKVVTPELIGPRSSDKTSVRTIDKQARGSFRTIERSCSFSTFERNTFSGEDPSAMTIDFLRARLQQQRADYRAEKQRSQQLAQKVWELEQKLSIEVQLRKEAERINRDLSMRDENHSTGSNDVLLHEKKGADISDKNIEEDGDKSCAVTRLQQSSFPEKQRPDHADSHSLLHEEQFLNKNSEQKKQSCSMREAHFSAQQQVDLASLASSARPKNQVSEIQQNDRQQTPSDLGNKEDSDQEVTKDRVTVELTQDRNTVVTLAPTDHMEDAKNSSQSIEGKTETLCVEHHKGVELKGAVVLLSEISVHNCLKDSGVANIFNISDKANDFYGAQHKLREAKIKNTETPDKADSMAPEVPNMMRNTEKRVNHFGVINGQVSEGSGITAIVAESVLSIDKAEIEGTFQDNSEFFDSQCGRKQIKGLPTAVGACNGSLLSCFQFDVQTEYSNGRLTKEDLVIERSQTREHMNSFSKEPDSSPEFIHNQQNSTQRKPRNMGKQLNLMDSGGVTWQGTVETDVSPGQTSENSNFVGATRNRHEPFPLSRFNNHDQPIQDFIASLKDFPHDQETQSFGTIRRDQDYNLQRAYGSEGLPCWMQSGSSAASIVTSSYSNSHKHVCSVAAQSPSSRRHYTGDGQRYESEFAPDEVKWAGISNAETPSTFASDTCSRLGSVSWRRNLSAHDSLNENRVSRPNSRNDFHDDDFSVRRIRGQEIEALESRELDRDLRYGHYHPYYHFEAERQGRLPIHISPFTQRIEPDWAAVPKQFSALPSEVGPNARLDLEVVAHRKFIDGGFDKVREILKALEMAKQHIQMSNEPIGSSPELPVRNQSPSRFWLQEMTGYPHNSLQLRMPKHPLTDQTS